MRVQIQMVIIMVITFSCIISCYSQEVERQVIVSGGDYINTSNLKVSWSIGEPLTETLMGQYKITQGFQQAVNTTVSLPDDYFRLDIVVFPNPSSSVINIKLMTEYTDKINVSVFDMEGRIVTNTFIKAGETTGFIDISDLSKAAYSLLFTDSQDNLLRSFIISKY